MKLEPILKESNQIKDEKNIVVEWLPVGVYI